MLKLNPEKAQAILVGTCSKQGMADVTMVNAGQSEIQLSETVKNLQFTSFLTTNLKNCRKCHFHLRNVRHLLSKYATHILVRGLVLTRSTTAIVYFVTSLRSS